MGFYRVVIILSREFTCIAWGAGR